METNTFACLLERARGGDASALRSLLEEFEEDVRTIVRVRLPRLLRSKFDSLDFVQSVWATVFVARDAQTVAFADPEHFRNYLAGIARNKVLAEYRRRTRTRKYDLTREEPLYLKRGDRLEPRPILAPDPTPSAEAQATERLERLLAGRSPVEAQVVELRRGGLTHREIASRLGVHERSVRRIIEVLERRAASQGSGP
jgi:RNA polymerase sigma-70 factor (ECF subfamily)